MSNETESLKAKGYFVAVLDGKQNTTKSAFLKNIGVAFNFPDYYGQNLDALNDCLNDLDWLEEKNYALVIENASELLSAETGDKKDEVLHLLKETSHEWANVPNYDGEDDFREKADFKLIFK